MEREYSHSKPMDLINYCNNNSRWSLEDLKKHLNNSNEDLRIFQEYDKNEILSQRQWSCLKCTYLNDWDLRTCAICLNSKDFNSNIVYH